MYATEGTEEVLIGNVMPMHLLYVDDVVLQAHTQEDAQNLINVLQTFCMHSGLMVNGYKTKIMLMQIHKKEQLCNIYKKEQPCNIYNQK